MSETREAIYDALPTARHFHRSDAFIRGLMGPIGSGKSVACVMEMFIRAMRQPNGPDGWKRSRWGVIRNSYPELTSTTLKTFKDWSPPSYTRIVHSAPITATVRIPQQKLAIEFVFLSYANDDDVKKLLSLELTGGWINEAREVPKSALDNLQGRVGRYPSLRRGGAAWSGVIMDTNPTPTDHWWYKTFEEERPRGWELFRQPGAYVHAGEDLGWIPNSGAENLDNLPPDYYARLIPGHDREWIKVYVGGDYGEVLDGKPVYPEYRDDAHCARQDLEALAIPLRLGWDFGLTPAVILGQVTPRGQVRILDELVATDMGIRQFANEVVRPHLAAHYHGIKHVSACDPAGAQRSQTDERSCLDELRAAGFTPRITPTNAFIPRREAVAGFLNRMTDGRPTFLLSPQCTMLRRGFLGGYRYPKLRLAGAERHQDRPEKNAYSHPHDALQYLCLDLYGGMMRQERARQQQQAAAQARPAARRWGAYT